VDKNEFLAEISTVVTAFAATNIADMVILMLSVAQFKRLLIILSLAILRLLSHQY